MTEAEKPMTPPVIAAEEFIGYRPRESAFRLCTEVDIGVGGLA